MRDDGLMDLLVRPISPFEERLWALLEEGGDRIPLVTMGEARAAMLLLQLLGSGDGAGSDQAYQLASALARRLPDE